MIKGGYILQPRIIQESDISVAAPYVREIWSFLLREANCYDKKYDGHILKRGQLFRSYDDIKEGTKWYIGWRKMTYNENQMKKAMKFLRDTQRITTQKELGGVLITICKYDYYQDPKNYERTKDSTIESTIAEPLLNQPLPHTNNKGKNIKKDEEEIKEFIAPSLQNVKDYFYEKGYTEQSAERAWMGYEENKWIDSHGKKIKNWKQKMVHVWFDPKNKIGFNSQQPKQDKLQSLIDAHASAQRKMFPNGQPQFNNPMHGERNAAGLLAEPDFEPGV